MSSRHDVPTFGLRMTSTSTNPHAAGDRLQVIIAGGGVAALEVLLALREQAGHRVTVTVLAPTREFVYRPVTVGEAFGRSEARSYSLADIAADQHSRLVWDSLKRVDLDRRVAITGAGDAIRFDRLVVATGAVPHDPLPGALTFGGRDDVPALRELLDDLVRGDARSVAFALPAERMWALPLYELALMTAESLGQRGMVVPVTLVTPEEEPLGLFGPTASTAVSGLLEARGVTLRTSSLPAMVGSRVLRLAGGGELFVDRVVTVPQLEGPRLMGLPHDRKGFIPVDSHGRVLGADSVYAAGDATAFPIKQGGLATQQADAVAEAIAAEAGGGA